MSGRVSVRLSPNEEAQLERQELHRRRKLRLQQVREQERFIARQVRAQVQERRQQQLQTLADSLQLQWQQQQMLRLQALSTHYQHSLDSVGHGHRSAQENEPDLEALAQRSVERRERADERHREALRELSSRRQQEEQQQRRHTEARRKALLEEKRRAERVASLPPPRPDPVESIGKKTPRPLRPAAAERFSLTHCHMTAVDRETDPEHQPSAQQAAALEVQRLEELRREEARDRQERLERARLRGNHALRTEQHTQDRARLLCELERLQQADLMRRRQTVNAVPAQIFQPLYRQQELRDEQQRELEIAFQDVCTEERKVKGDLVLQLVPEPLPPLSSSSHDEELDVTLDPEGEEPETPGSETAAPPADAGRQALSRLLERIRRQRDQRSRQQTADTPETSRDGDTQEEALSVETGSLSSQEKASGGGLEQETPSTTHTEDAPDVSDEAVVAGTVLPPEERVHVESERAHMDQPTHVEALLRQQQEQLALLEELEEKRRELEQRLRDTQQTSATLQEAARRQSTTLPEPPAEVRSDVTQTQRLHQYQQRLLEQNRLHKKCVEEARRRLEEYQHTLKLRYTIGSTSAALQQPSVPLETPSAHRPALPLVLNPDAPVLHPGEAPAPSQPPQPKPSGSESSSPQGGQEDRVPEQDRLPLPPPSVVLELLRSRQHHAVPRSSEVSGSVTELSFGPVQTSVRSVPLLQDRQELRRQRDLLQALITADRQGSASSFSDVQTDRTTLNTLLNAIEEANGHTGALTAPSQRDGATHTTTVLSNSPSSMNHQHECFGAVGPDYLSSTTISTGSYSTSDHEPSYAISDASHLCIEPDVCGLSPKSSSCHMTTDQAQEIRDSAQQIIDKYSKELSASLRRAGVTSGAVNSSSASPSWSSALQEECSLHDGDAAERRSSSQSSAEPSGVFQPLQPHPDVDSSSSSSSSTNAVRADQSTRAQGWSEAVNRILERLSDQLSIRRSEQGHGTTPAEPRLSPSVCGDQHSSTVRQTRTGHVHSTLWSAEDRSASPDQSAVSRLIGRASDMGSSQVFDQSSVLADGPEEVSQSTAAGPALRFSPVRSSLQPSASQMMTDEPQDDASDLFLPLPSEVTANETADCSRALCVPLEAEPCCAAEASDWLEATDQSLTSLQHLRVDTLLQSQPDLQISMDALSLTHESLCDADAVAPPTAADVSLMPRSPLKTSLQEDRL
uniref:Centrosomal protein of 295 kDa n=1 Tax=Cyprinus carpio carpio TaxID=630221 RepID=A0A9J8C2F0_CYPCA